MPRRTIVGHVALVVVPVVLLVVLVVKVGADAPAAPSRAEPRGLVVNRPGASPGLTLFSPLELRETLLVDLDGAVKHRWQTSTPPGLSQYLLENGHLLRAGDLGQPGRFAAGRGAGGRIEELDWDGKVVWRFDYGDDQVMQHHDVAPLPNGNVLFVAWELVSDAEAIRAGRDPALLPDGELWPDKVVEYSPLTDEIVWEWRVWDHLIQDHDPTKENYGNVAEHPEKIDVNFLLDGNDGDADWNHVNSVTYNAERDEVMISSRSFSELWVVDHAATTAEATGPAGDLQFRYGNPRAYKRGTRTDQQLFVQHDPVWIPDGTDGKGNILVFSNGLPKVRPYSSVEEITPDLDGDGDYLTEPEGVFAASISRVYPTRPADRFFAAIVSGAQRLPNGNTLIAYGNYGRLLEVTRAGEIVWEYENPWYQVNDDTPSRTGAGFVIEPWWTFRAQRYEPSYPGLSHLTREPDQTDDSSQG